MPASAAHQYRLQTRLTPGGPSNSIPAGSGVAGVWLRVVRAGNTFTASFSPDGATWNALGGATTIAMPATITVGLGVTSHSTTATLASGVFDSVSITQP